MLSFDAEQNNVCPKNKTFQGAVPGRLSNHLCTQSRWRNVEGYLAEITIAGCICSVRIANIATL